MLLSKDTCVIRRENNVVLVDFTRKPEPPTQISGGECLAK